MLPFVISFFFPVHLFSFHFSNLSTSIPGLFPHLSHDLIGLYRNMPHDCDEGGLGDIHVLWRSMDHGKQGSNRSSSACLQPPPWFVQKVQKHPCLVHGTPWACPFFTKVSWIPLPGRAVPAALVSGKPSSIR